MQWIRSMFVAACGLAFFAPALLAQDRPPNFVVVFIDDLGYGDIGPFGANDIDTPNLDRMAREGRVFTDFYVTQSVCSPSRASLLTGCYHVRVGVTRAIVPSDQAGLSPEETTIAELLKTRGYATACYGKWHLGHHPKFLPTNQGFDDFFGLPYSNDMWPEQVDVVHLPLEQRLRAWPYLRLLEDDTVLDPRVSAEVQQQLTTRYTERAVQFIQQNRDRPFFLYVPHSMVHVPLFVSEKFAGKSRRGLYGDVVMELDWSMGQILDALRDNDLAEETLVIFTGDNGPWLNYGTHAGQTGPLREGKWSTFEGGVREPTIMWQPGKIPAGTVSREPLMTIDLLPTFAALAGAALPERPIDGKDVWPLIVGQEGAQSPHEAYYFYYGGRLEALRAGQWKLHFPHGYPTLAGRETRDDGFPVPYRSATIGLSLFDLENDPGETTDVADQHPDVVRRLLQLADAERADLGDATTGQPGPGRRSIGVIEPGDLYYPLENGVFLPPTRR